MNEGCESRHAARAAVQLELIERYLGQASDLWEVDPVRAMGRDLFIEWELSNLPEPFVADSQLAIGDNVITPMRPGMIGGLFWDMFEEQPVLALEDEDARQEWCIDMTGGYPEMTERAASIRDRDEISYGERLEFIYDILKWCGDSRPFWNVRTMSREQYLTALAGVSGEYPDATVKLMRRMPIRNVIKLIGSACHDMADDELSNQLTLPLDGTYSAAIGRVGMDPGIPAYLPPAVTPGRIYGALKFLHGVLNAVAEADEVAFVRLSGAEVLQQRGNTWTLRVAIDDNVVAEEGSRLRVKQLDDTHPAGKFFVDIRERQELIGRLEWDGPAPESPESFARGGYVADAPQSATPYLRDQIQELFQNFFRQGRLPAPTLKAALGHDVVLMPPLPGGEPVRGLDAMQSLAWRAATQDARTIALIQGPPGTGKTHVLEHALRQLIAEGRRVLLVAPSHAAVDNICRRVLDQPLLRLGRDGDKFSPDMAPVWIENKDAVRQFLERRSRSGGSLYAGTPLGLMRAPLVHAEIEQKGLFDVLVVDEAGMAPVAEFLLTARLARRAVLFGDHQQLRPFPLSPAVEQGLREQVAAPPELWQMATRSALEWLAAGRGLPVTMLRTSYRCQNPRLMRFSSVLFYDAAVRASSEADYFQLDWDARRNEFPPGTLRLYDTSPLLPKYKYESMRMDGGRPGIENTLEAAFCCGLVYRLLRRLPLAEISVIAPYRRQIRLIRHMLAQEKATATAAVPFTDADWQQFIHTRVATVDSFQGSESDAVIICYARSNARGVIGFVDDPNRINVAHSRCRRELHIVGDMDTLQRGDRGTIFQRLVRAVRRDGELVPLTDSLAAELLARAVGGNRR